MTIEFLPPAVSLPEDESETETVTTADMMNLVEVSGTLDFWNDPEEDVYDRSNRAS